MNKVLHPCSAGMCAGEDAAQIRDNITVGLTVNDVNASVQAEGTARAHFEIELAAVLAQALLVATDEVTVSSMTVADVSDLSDGAQRRWLQDQNVMDVAVSLIVAADTDVVQMLVQKIEALRSSNTTLSVGGRATARTSSFSMPTVSSYSTAGGVQCREGHDPASPLCHVCVDGWMEASDQNCIQCGGESVAWVRVVALVVGIVVVSLLVAGGYRWYHHWAAKGVAKAAFEYRWVKPSFVGGGAVSLSIYFKICTSHFQILSQFPILFDIVFPENFQRE